VEKERKRSLCRRERQKENRRECVSCWREKKSATVFLFLFQKGEKGKKKKESGFLLDF
jgi:hypothetical protein